MIRQSCGRIQQQHTLPLTNAPDEGDPSEFGHDVWRDKTDIF